MAAAAAGKGADHSYVADAQNWDQRVTAELESSKAWQHNWGELYTPGAPKSYGARIDKIESELASLPPSTLKSHNNSYGVGVPFKEIKVTKTLIKNLDP